jgi:hypothetical protein
VRSKRCSSKKLTAELRLFGRQQNRFRFESFDDSALRGAEILMERRADARRSRE